MTSILGLLVSLFLPTEIPLVLTMSPVSFLQSAMGILHPSGLYFSVGRDFVPLQQSRGREASYFSWSDILFYK